MTTSEHSIYREHDSEYNSQNIANTSEHELEHEGLGMNTSEHKSKCREHESKIVKIFIKNVIATNKCARNKGNGILKHIVSW